MAQTIDFDSLVNDLFSKEPIEEKVQELPQSKRNDSEISKALTKIYQTEKPFCIQPTVELDTPTARRDEANISSLPACTLYVFMRKIVMGRFGMGHDYAFSDRAGVPLKSWFSIPEAIEAAERQGYRLTVSDCRAYLDELMRHRYIETDGYKYRRSMIWCEQMESYLLRSLRSSHA